MKIKEYKNDLLKESVFCAEHPSGLEIRVMPKEGYDSAYAVFGVKYGSIDTFLKKEDGTFEPIPEGTAHFLEHKLFESEELDAFELFAKTGASANAYTSFEKTAYLFKGSSNIDKSLDYLLDFVQNPYFTAETVKKEQGIIGQEIRMYQDLPDWMVMFNLLRALYKDNPVRVDIAGTQESIAKIDDKLLYNLYETFYNPSNMVLCIVGNVNPDDVFAKVEKSIKREKKKVPERKFAVDTPKANQKYIDCKLAVGRKQFLLGYKEAIKSPEISIDDESASNVMLEALFGKSSSFFSKNYNDGIIDTTFGSEIFNGFGFSAVMIGGSADEPEKVAELIKAEIENAKKNGIDKSAFERAKKKLYGRTVMCYNDIDDIANLLMSLYFTGYKPFDEVESIKNVTYEMVMNRLNTLNEEGCALSVILPIE